MSRHIGIVACSAEGAALCYRMICTQNDGAPDPYDHPEVSLHTQPFARYVTHLERRDWTSVGELMLASARHLANSGADFLICPDNTIHQALPHIASRSPLPWLHIADAVVDAAKERGFRNVGITGTQWLVDSEVYPERFRAAGIATTLPSETDRVESNRFIMDEMVRGIFRPEAVAHFQQLIADFKSRGCDAVVLGCTEIPLIVGDENAALPTLDSTRLLAAAAVRRARSDA